MSSPLQAELSPYLAELERRFGYTEGQPLPDPSTLLKPTDAVSSDLLQATRDAIETWTAVAGNQSLLDDIKTMPFYELCEALKSIVADDTFSDLFEKARGEPSAKQSSSNKINSVTFTMTLDVTVAVGVAAGIGIAINPHDMTDLSVFVMGAIPVGVEEEVEVSFDIGFESNAPADLSTVKLGVQASADAIVGISATIAFEADLAALMSEGLEAAIDLSNWSVTLGESDGEGGGVAFFVEARIVIIEDAMPLIAQPTAPHCFDIEAVYCGNTMDDVGKDEIYVTFKLDTSDDTYRFPPWDTSTSHRSITEYSEDDGVFQTHDDDLQHASFPDKQNANDTYWNIYRTAYCNEQVQVHVYQGSGHTLYNKTVKISDFDIGERQNWNYKDEDGVGGVNKVAYRLWIKRRS